MPVAINDDNGNLIVWWIWHLDTANSDCEGRNGEQLSGWFVSDATATLPLTIAAGGGKATVGEHIVRLVEIVRTSEVRRWTSRAGRPSS